MIAELRDRHCRTWIVLAVVVPATILAAWSLRRGPVVMERIPAGLMHSADTKP